jgi:hypothetical protein
MKCSVVDGWVWLIVSKNPPPGVVQGKTAHTGNIQGKESISHLIQEHDHVGKVQDDRPSFVGVQDRSNTISREQICSV